MVKFSLSKADRLKSEKTIGILFTSGEMVKSYPIRAKFLYTPAEKTEVQAAFSAPKRSFKKAVDRNKCKRLLRECYRLNKSVLTDCTPTGTYKIMFIYGSKEILEFEPLQKAMQKVLDKMVQKVLPQQGQ